MKQFINIILLLFITYTCTTTYANRSNCVSLLSEKKLKTDTSIKFDREEFDWEEALNHTPEDLKLVEDWEAIKKIGGKISTVRGLTQPNSGLLPVSGNTSIYQGPFGYVVFGDKQLRRWSQLVPDYLLLSSERGESKFNFRYTIEDLRGVLSPFWLEQLQLSQELYQNALENSGGSKVAVKGSGINEYTGNQRFLVRKNSEKLKNKYRGLVSKLSESVFIDVPWHTLQFDSENRSRPGELILGGTDGEAINWMEFLWRYHLIESTLVRQKGKLIRLGELINLSSDVSSNLILLLALEPFISVPVIQVLAKRVSDAPPFVSGASLSGNRGFNKKTFKIGRGKITVRGQTSNFWIQRSGESGFDIELSTLESQGFDKTALETINQLFSEEWNKVKSVNDWQEENNSLFNFHKARVSFRMADTKKSVTTTANSNQLQTADVSGIKFSVRGSDSAKMFEFLLNFMAKMDKDFKFDLHLN